MSDHTTTALAVLSHRAELEATASSLAKAGPMLPRHLQQAGPPALLAVLLTGAELGMSPMQAIRSLHLVEGRVVVDASAQLALAISRGIRTRWAHSDATRAALHLSRPGDEHGYTSTYTIEMAERAGLAGRATWKAHTEAMLRARAITAGIRAYCPDVLGGVAYSPDELADAQEPREVARVVSSAPAAQPSRDEAPVPVEAEVVEVPDWPTATWDEVVEALAGQGIDAERVDAARLARGDMAIQEMTPQERGLWLTRSMGAPASLRAMRARCGVSRE